MSEILNMAMSVHARYLMPFVIGLMAILFSDHIINVIYTAIGAGRSRR